MSVSTWANRSGERLLEKEHTEISLPHTGVQVMLFISVQETRNKPESIKKIEKHNQKAYIECFNRDSFPKNARPLSRYTVIFSLLLNRNSVHTTEFFYIPVTAGTEFLLMRPELHRAIVHSLLQNAMTVIDKATATFSKIPPYVLTVLRWLYAVMSLWESHSSTKVYNVIVTRNTRYVSRERKGKYRLVTKLSITPPGISRKLLGVRSQQK